MIITAITLQAHDNNRVNVFVDGVYQFSLDVFQLTELGLKVGYECDATKLASLKQEGEFSKVYGRALEYCMMRPHSKKEVLDYLYRKTKPSKTRDGSLKPGISPFLANRVFDRLVEKKYLDDEKFAAYWVENRSIVKGISQRKLVLELKLKGVDETIIKQALYDVSRDDSVEIKKIIVKKRRHYPDERKLIAYLARQGFNYDDIKQSLAETDNSIASRDL